MRWQDIVISVCQIGFLIALLPSIRSHHKPAVATSVMYALFITTIATSLLTLQLWFSAATAYAGAIPWLTLAIQKHKIDKESK